MKEITVIEDSKQVKVFLSKTRREMLCQMSKKEMTITQLASKFGKTPATVHYHMKKLLEAEFAALTKIVIVNNNLVQKYYVAKLPSKCILAIRRKPKSRGPVPPKGYGKVELCVTRG